MKTIIIYILMCSVLIADTNPLFVNALLKIDNKEDYFRYSENSKESNNCRYHAAFYVIEITIGANGSGDVESMVRIGNCLDELEKMPKDFEFRKDDLIMLTKTIDWSLVNQNSLKAAQILKRKTGVGLDDADFLNLDEEQRKAMCKKWTDAIEKMK